MSELPRPLQRWAAQLALFSPDVAQTIGHLLPRLSLVLGDFNPERDARHGEPAGYDGLSRRGPVERLLTTEWLWALELPDEFLRRAAMHEQAYLAPAYRAPPRALHCTVLLDVGPSQLGTPRLAQLALLVALEQRAEAAKATFSFGVLQRPADGLLGVLSEASVRRWLAARELGEVSSPMVSRWRERLTRTEAGGEVWVVGAKSLAALEGVSRWSRIDLEDVVAPGHESLVVQVYPQARSARQVTLPLPSGSARKRVLRDPFEAHARPAANVVTRAPGHPDGKLFAFAPDGALVLSLGNGDVVVQPLRLNHGPSKQRERRIIASRGEQLLAVGYSHRGGVGALARWRRDEPSMVLRSGAGTAYFAASLRGESRVWLLNLAGMNLTTTFGWMSLLDDAGRLWRFSNTEGDWRVEAEVTDVLACTAAGRSSLLVVTSGRASGESGTVYVSRLNHHSEEQLAELACGDAAPPVVFGPGRAEAALVAVRGLRDPSGKGYFWHVVDGRKLSVLTAPESVEVVGVCVEPDQKLALVYLGPTRKHVWSESREPGRPHAAPRIIFTSESPIRKATVDTVQSRVAVLSADGAVTVVDLLTRARWLTRVPEDAS